MKSTIIDAANQELVRIAPEALGDVWVGLDQHNRIALSDSLGYYPASNYRTLVDDLRTITATITDPLYDGEDRFVWEAIWSLFDEC